MARSLKVALQYGVFVFSTLIYINHGRAAAVIRPPDQFYPKNH
jgi:hypothetical protein